MCVEVYVVVVVVEVGVDGVFFDMVFDDVGVEVVDFEDCL